MLRLPLQKPKRVWIKNGRPTVTLFKITHGFPDRDAKTKSRLP